MSGRQRANGSKRITNVHYRCMLYAIGLPSSMGWYSTVCRDWQAKYSLGYSVIHVIGSNLADVTL